MPCGHLICTLQLFSAGTELGGARPDGQRHTLPCGPSASCCALPCSVRSPSPPPPLALAAASKAQPSTALTLAAASSRGSRPEPFMIPPNPAASRHPLTLYALSAVSTSIFIFTVNDRKSIINKLSNRTLFKQQAAPRWLHTAWLQARQFKSERMPGR